MCFDDNGIAVNYILINSEGKSDSIYKRNELTLPSVGDYIEYDYKEYKVMKKVFVLRKDTVSNEGKTGIHIYCDKGK